MTVTELLAQALTKAIFPMAAEYLAALAPMTRLGGGLVSLAGPSEAACWPAGAEQTADLRFAPGEVRVDALTGTWEDGNGRQAAFAWAEAVAGRLWRRPDDPCGPQDAFRRLLALLGAAILLTRMRERGYPLPAIASPPMAAELPPEAATTEEVVSVPVVVLGGLVTTARALEALVRDLKRSEAVEFSGVSLSEVQDSAAVFAAYGEAALAALKPRN
ncbi:hypothetical protein [Xanthobacter sp. ZOL 2024]